jgi:peptidase E
MSERKPVYLLAGGRPANRRANDALVREALRGSGKEAPSVGYVGTANSDDDGFFHRMAAMFRENGAGEIARTLLAGKAADIPSAKHILEQADIVYVSGGDVDTGMRILVEKQMVGFLRELYHGGKPFFGLSAGSIMLARQWVRWRDPDDDATAELFPCLGIAPVLCDTHDEEGGWEELRALLNLEPAGADGYGIAAGTALKVFPDGRLEARGGPVHRYGKRSGIVARAADLMPS